MHLHTTSKVVVFCSLFLASGLYTTPAWATSQRHNDGAYQSPTRRSPISRSPARIPDMADGLERPLFRSLGHHGYSDASLRARDDDILPLRNGWWMKFLYVDSGLPVQIASALLADYYQRVYERVIECARTLEPMKAMSLKILDMRLDFQCETSVIHWDFVKSFMIAMIDATKRGFTGRFRALMYHGPTETMIVVGLRIISSQEAADSTENNAGL